MTAKEALKQLSIVSEFLDLAGRYKLEDQLSDDSVQWLCRELFAKTVLALSVLEDHV